MRRTFFVGASLLCGACSGQASGATQGGDPNLDGLHCSEAFMDGKAWLEVGQGIAEFELLEDGDEYRIVLGGQGFFMFPLGLRAGGFCVPEDLSDRDEFPILDAEIFVEDARVAWMINQPLDFLMQDDDSYALMTLPLILDDDMDPADLEGKPGSLEVELWPYEVAPLSRDVDFVAVVQD